MKIRYHSALIQIMIANNVPQMWFLTEAAESFDSEMTENDFENKEALS